jgi:hypothetical protein
MEYLNESKNEEKEAVGREEATSQNAAYSGGKDTHTATGFFGYFAI